MDLETLDIRHEEAGDRGAFFIEENGERVAEQTYQRVDARHVVIDHTVVNPKVRLRGVARRIMDRLIAWARAEGIRVSATCSYAQAQFDKDPSIRDVLG